MQLEKWEIADKYTIFKVKKKHGLDVEEQLQQYEEAAKDIDADLLHALYSINEEMYDVENLISALFKDKDWPAAGKAYHYLRSLTHHRTRAKNAIAAKYDKFKEEKEYNDQ
jgi:hypothetical protein